jgi:hypothetical protein
MTRSIAKKVEDFKSKAENKDKTYFTGEDEQFT